MVHDNNTGRDESNGPTPSRRQVLRAAGATAVGGAALVGSAGATEFECVDCVYVGKIEGEPEVGDTYEFTYGEKTLGIEVQGVTREDGEVICATFYATSGSICKVAVKGGPTTNVRTFSKGQGNIPTCAPLNKKNPNRDRYAISNVEFYLCLAKEADENTKNGDKDKDEPTERGPPEHAGPSKRGH